MVLASLGTSALKDFRAWLLEHFGFEVYPQSVGDGARIALRMKEAGSDAEFNLADMGFGFSQMLPFLVQIWYLVEQAPSRVRRYYGQQAIPPSYIIAIEQPELHLHPALQSRVADLFVAMAAFSAEEGLPVRFVLETHSPTIIERLGAHVEAGSLLQQDVQVLLFDRGEDETKPTTATVRVAEFDEQGVLKNWPFGFLSPPPGPVGKPLRQVVGR
jgi:predicted ATPase